MAYRKKTLRRIPETTRKLARLINSLDSTTTKLKNLLPDIERLEHDSMALFNSQDMLKGALAKAIDNIKPDEIFREAAQQATDQQEAARIEQISIPDDSAPTNIGASIDQET